MDPLDVPNVPADMRQYVDTGPIPRFASYAEMEAAMAPAQPGMLASIGRVVMTYNGYTWVQCIPAWWTKVNGTNHGTAASVIEELNTLALPLKGTYWIQAYFEWDSLTVGVGIELNLWVGAGAVYFGQMHGHQGSGKSSAVLGGIVTINEAQNVSGWLNHYFGAGCTTRCDLSAWAVDFHP